jgi:hypothetical protein
MLMLWSYCLRSSFETKVNVMTRQFGSWAILLMLLIAGQAEASPIGALNIPTGEIGTPSGIDPAFFYYYHDVSGNTAEIELSGEDLGSDTFLITSGTLNVTGGIDIGAYSLFPSGPAVTLSQAGAFLIDNVLYYGNNPVLDNWGLLFTGNGLEINLWGNGPDNYSFWSYNGNGYNVSVDGGFLDSRAMVLDSYGPEGAAPVPEPSTLYLLGGGIAGLCAYRIKQGREQESSKKI